MSALAVEIEGVNKWYGPHHALRDVSLGLGEGEKLVLCGPSGSGKSTLIRCINGLESFQEGQISVCGRRLDGTAAALREVRAMSGMVFQNFNLFPHLTVLENLCIGPVHGRGMAREVAVARGRELLARVRLADQEAKYPGQISGGQAQRVAIARTLMLEPKVLLFDEPTSALDPEMIHEVLEVMEELAAAGQSMICVTHEMGFARRVADLVVFMDAGRIVEATDPGSFFEGPSSPRAAEFVRQISQGD